MAEALGGFVEGNPDETVTSFAKIEHGKKGQLCFLANMKYEHYLYDSKASVMLVAVDFKPRGPIPEGMTLVRTPNPYDALAQLLAYVKNKKKQFRRHRGRCRIAWSAKLGKRVWVGDFVTIGAKTQIGDNTRICDNVTIGANVKIGSECIIYPGAVLFADTVVGDRCILHAGCIIGDDGFGNVRQEDGSWKKIEHLGNVVIGNDVEIGSNATVDKAPMESTIVGNGARIDNLCVIAHNVKVGENVAMAAQCGIAGSTEIGDRCILAGQVGVIGHLKIAPDTTFCAQSGVIGNIKESGGVYVGAPAIKHRTFMKAYAKFKKTGEE